MSAPCARVLAVWLLVGACSAPTTGARMVSVYRCADGRSFSVLRDSRTANVEYGNERFRLTRRPRGIGIQYASPEATLILDDDYAAFVSETVIDLEACEAVAT